MRTREEFKNYVYQKAEEKRLFSKKRNTLLYRSIATFSLVIVLSGAMLYQMNNNKKALEDGNTIQIADDSDLEKIQVYALAECGTEESLIIADNASRVITSDDVEIFDYSSVLKSRDKVNSYDNFADYLPIDEGKACDIAKKVCTVDYDTVSIAYDPATRFWRVIFCQKDVVGGDQTVYLDEFGTVDLIVYGE